jgi:hypothetical protein
MKQYDDSVSSRLAIDVAKQKSYTEGVEELAKILVKDSEKCRRHDYRRHVSKSSQAIDHQLAENKFLNKWRGNTRAKYHLQSIYRHKAFGKRICHLIFRQAIPKGYPRDTHNISYPAYRKANANIAEKLFYAKP